MSPEFSDFEDIAELIIEAASDPSVEGDLAELFRRNMMRRLELAMGSLEFGAFSKLSP